MSEELVAILDGRETGRVVRDDRGRLSFAYKEVWRDAAEAYPLSISMPLALAEHGHAKIDPFLWGLLPDNEMVLDRWARKFQVSARNAFGLIACVGEDCAGAIQFVRPQRLEASSDSYLPPSDGLMRPRLRSACARLAGRPLRVFVPWCHVCEGRAIDLFTGICHTVTDVYFFHARRC